MKHYDVIVVGAGANGLAAAALLARRKRRVLVIERRDLVGGTNATEEFAPGFKAGTCRDDVGWIPTSLVRNLDLGRHGLHIISAPAGLVGVTPDNPPVATFPDVGRTRDSLRQISNSDADRWGEFGAFMGRMAALFEWAYSVDPPPLRPQSTSDWLELAGLGRRIRGLGRHDMMELLRLVPMAVSDLAEEWFHNEVLRTMLAVQGTRDVLHGPLSGGTALILLHHHVGLAAGSMGVRLLARGGNGALTDSLAAAARETGVEIRLAAEVSQVLVRDFCSFGVVLNTGEEIHARDVLSSVDPRRSLSWVDPKWLDPEFLLSLDHVRMRGGTARVHLALDGLPRVLSGGREVPRDMLGGVLTLAGSVVAVERAADSAVRGLVPERPPLTLAFPTLLDASLAPERRHVLSVTVHKVPCGNSSGWDRAASDSLADKVTGIMSEVMPDLPERILARRVVTPADLERDYACTGGSLTHGDIALDQFLFMRPVPSCANHSTPLPGFWLGGTGSHPANPSGGSGQLAARALLAKR